MRDMMGGFMELQLPETNNLPFRESSHCAFVSSGRAALECLLRSLKTPPEAVWVPRFACNTLLEPMHRLGVPIKRYGVGEDFSFRIPRNLSPREVLLLIDYFGFGGETIAEAAARHKGLSIVDATTALFAQPPRETASFYSLRKFVGTSDGGIAQAPFPIALPPGEDRSAKRALFMLQRAEEGANAALPANLAAEEELHSPALRMSPLTRKFLDSIDFEKTERRRRENYRILYEALHPINRLHLPEKPPSAPFCYPLVSGIPRLRDELIDAGVALPLFWPEVIEENPAYSSENRLARTLLPLPLDQRYSKADMERLIRLILG